MAGPVWSRFPQSVSEELLRVQKWREIRDFPSRLQFAKTFSFNKFELFFSFFLFSFAWSNPSVGLLYRDYHTALERLRQASHGLPVKSSAVPAATMQVQAANHLPGRLASNLAILQLSQQL
ncbi:uncharacterized protein BO97DRAFT_237251 [Aspergillus homomorphus CBS 101889]|uniref:Uncharacterized protein n=1 Tax=Aspergillus homomorphus (strain CBS 101889) TaxID=1450537 RepID=A0A395I5J2_ASPHC|nr:hypothetical protein BO97DRAFT_237251 [Aspergillus homomorphus CBS 101889]RAL15055.1 hypothetical protein BO97DRAFT_237251 [Aspergillus homomorphus CBS 101889]